MLYISNNAIGDDGINAIATALTNSRIRQLWVGGCDITLTGARSLATLLSFNQCIILLWLCNNPITTEGAHVILQSVVNNVACQATIKIDDEYRRDSVVQILMNIIMRGKLVTTTTVITRRYSV